MKRNHITKNEWLELPQSARVLLSIALGLKRKEAHVMVNGRLMSDGHTPEELMTVDVKRLQKYLKNNKEDDITILLKQAADKATNKKETHDATTATTKTGRS